MPSARWSVTTLPPARVLEPPARCDWSCASAAPAASVMPASSAAAPPRLTRRRRRRRADSARRARERRRASSQGPGDPRSVVGTAIPRLVSTPTGLAVGLARRPALRRTPAAIRPRRPRPPLGPPLPAARRRGLGWWVSGSAAVYAAIGRIRAGTAVNCSRRALFFRAYG